ncbi:MAG: membrane protein [Isosphaeraceae bacterium]|jgi:uncharacterized protein (DUF58 family)|nr:MAG: membrane protein [Isosphaeraceae bacterium]
MSRAPWSRILRRTVDGRLRLTRAGSGYLGVWLILLLAGLQQQNNLILLTAGMAAGPLVASLMMSLFMLRRLRVERRLPDHVFEGKTLSIDYLAENRRLLTAALAVEIQDELNPSDRSIPHAARLRPRAVFERVGPRDRVRIRWEAPSPVRGRYELGRLEIITRAPFGLIERRLTVDAPASLIVYPRIGSLTRRWNQLWRESTQSRRGHRHDRTAQQQEYHGLRDYRSGDSPRWLHWRTSARVGRLMVKEFEQENDQEIAILLDAWLPRSRPSPEQREAVELAIRFAASVCLNVSRSIGRRLVLGWTGPTPGVRQGPAGPRLTHELLQTLAVHRAQSEGHLSSLFDALPPAVLRDALIVVVTTRPVNLAEEAARVTRLTETAARSLASRLVILEVHRGDLDPYITFDASPPFDDEAAPVVDHPATTPEPVAATIEPVGS